MHELVDLDILQRSGHALAVRSQRPMAVGSGCLTRDGGWGETCASWQPGPRLGPDTEHCALPRRSARGDRIQVDTHPHPHPRVQRISLHMRREMSPSWLNNRSPDLWEDIVMSKASQGGLRVPLGLHSIILGAPQTTFKESTVMHSCLYSYLFVVRSLDSHLR